MDVLLGTGGLFLGGEGVRGRGWGNILAGIGRLADDLVDELGDPARALSILHRRLDRV